MVPARSILIDVRDIRETITNYATGPAQKKRNWKVIVGFNKQALAEIDLCSPIFGNCSNEKSNRYSAEISDRFGETRENSRASPKIRLSRNAISKRLRLNRNEISYF